MNDIDEKLVLAYNATPLLIALFDEFDVLRFMNAAFQESYQIEDKEAITWAALMRRCFEQRIGAKLNCVDFEHWLASASSRRGKLPFRSFEADLWDGRWILMTESVDSSGWMQCIATDISSMHTSERNLRIDRDIAIRLAKTDSLTGISNRAHILELLNEVLSDISAKTTYVAIFDLDHFKEINDQYGHLVGDSVLRDFSSAVRKLLRRNDMFGRSGGEEFLMILPDCDLTEAVQIIERILFAIQSSHSLCSYTSSVGVTAIRSFDTIVTVTSRADQALYQAKSDGRNCVRIF